MKAAKRLILCAFTISATFNLIQLPALSQTQSNQDPQDKSNQDPCRKNVMIYFDASHSMIENVGGESIMQFMLRFMKEATSNKELFKNGDLVLLKKFAEKSYPFYEIGGEFEVDDTNREQIMARIDDNLYRFENLKIRAEHNNYINLLEDIRQQVLSTPSRGKVMNYVVIFSDFLYDPPYGRDYLIKHKTDLGEQLFRYRDFFDNYKYRLILIYKKNPKLVKKGIDVFDSYNRMRYTKSIISPENIAQLIEDLKKEIIQPIRVISDESRFLYENGTMSLKLTLENPNCEDLRANSVEISSVTNISNETISLASRSSSSESGKIFKPLIRNELDIPLKGTPSFKEIIENGYHNKTYNISYSIDTNWGPTEDSFQLTLKEEDFIEHFEVEIENFIFVDHLFKAFDKLFVKLKFGGVLLDKAKLTVSPEMESFTFKQIEPILPVIFSPDEKLSNKNHNFIYEAKSVGNFPLASIKNTETSIHLNWGIEHDERTIHINFTGANSSEGTLEKKVESINYRNYVYLEIVLFFFLVFIGVTIRVYFYLIRRRHNLEGRSTHAIDNR